MAENLQLSGWETLGPKERLRILEVLRGEDLNLKVGFHYAVPRCKGPLVKFSTRSLWERQLEEHMYIQIYTYIDMHVDILYS